MQPEEAEKRPQIIFRCLRPDRANPRRSLVKHSAEAGSLPSTKTPFQDELRALVGSPGPKSSREKPVSEAAKGTEHFLMALPTVAPCTARQRGSSPSIGRVVVCIPHVLRSPDQITALPQRASATQIRSRKAPRAPGQQKKAAEKGNAVCRAGAPQPKICSPIASPWKFGLSAGGRTAW